MSNTPISGFSKFREIFTDNINVGGINKDDENKVSFGNLLNETINMTNQTEAQDQISSEALLTGNVDDIGQVMVDMQKAELALQMTVQIRNKVVDAYNEVMRMQL